MLLLFGSGSDTGIEYRRFADFIYNNDPHIQNFLLFLFISFSQSTLPSSLYIVEF